MDNEDFEKMIDEDSFIDEMEQELQENGCGTKRSRRSFSNANLSEIIPSQTNKKRVSPLLVILAVVFLICIGIFIYSNTIDYRNYNKAVRLILDEQDVREAYPLFNVVEYSKGKDYRDVKAFIDYCKAVQSYQDGSYYAYIWIEDTTFHHVTKSQQKKIDAFKEELYQLYLKGLQEQNH